MSAQRFRVARLDEIAAVEDQPFVEGEWRPVRRALGVTAFGTNAYVANAGQRVIEEHDELHESAGPDAGHQEMYFVHRGRAEFTVDGEKIDAPAGTYVFLPEPAAVRGAIALEDDTAVLVVGTFPDRPFAVSAWEQRFSQ